MRDIAVVIENAPRDPLGKKSGILHFSLVRLRHFHSRRAGDGRSPPLCIRTSDGRREQRRMIKGISSPSLEVRLGVSGVSIYLVVGRAIGDLTGNRDD